MFLIITKACKQIVYRFFLWK